MSSELGPHGPRLQLGKPNPSSMGNIEQYGIYLDGKRVGNIYAGIGGRFDNYLTREKDTEGLFEWIRNGGTYFREKGFKEEIRKLRPKLIDGTRP